MTLPCPGPAPISLLDIQNEFGGTYLNDSTKIIEYYRGGPYVEDNSANARIPKSGQISFADFFCGDGEIVVEIGSGTDVLMSRLFGKYWGQLRPKRLIISSGAVIGGTSYYFGSGALNVDDDSGRTLPVGKLTIENRGSIQGAPGQRGGTPRRDGETRNPNNGGNGGSALRVSRNYSNLNLILQNTSSGSIYAGGGGGGFGGTNPQTSYTTSQSSSTSNYSIQVGNGGGGNGGYGQGYLQANTLGESESVSIGANFNSVSSIGVTGNLSRGSNAQHNSTSFISGNYRLASGSQVNFNVSSGSINGTFYLSSGSQAYFNVSGGSIFATVYVPSGAYAYFNGSGSSISVTSYGPGSVSVSSSGGSGNVSRNVNTPVSDQDIIAPSISGSVGDLSFNTGELYPNSPAAYGGNGGTYGNPGSAGNNGSLTSGSPGGSSGYAIVGRDGISSIENSGIIVGPLLAGLTPPPTYSA